MNAHLHQKSCVISPSPQEDLSNRSKRTSRGEEKLESRPNVSDLSSLAKSGSKQLTSGASKTSSRLLNQEAKERDLPFRCPSERKIQRVFKDEQKSGDPGSSSTLTSALCCIAESKNATFRCYKSTSSGKSTRSIFCSYISACQRVIHQTAV